MITTKKERLFWIAIVIATSLAVGVLVGNFLATPLEKPVLIQELLIK